MAKLYATWWAAGLAPKLPSGIAVCAVSPGNTPATCKVIVELARGLDCGSAGVRHAWRTVH